MEGRDIGTVVFPDAEIKIFLDADISARAERRHKEMIAKGINIDLEDLKKEILERDRANSEREIAPLKKAIDSLIVDTTGMTLDEQADYIAGLVKKFENSDLPE